MNEDDDDVLLENDPLAIYLLQNNITDFETIKTTVVAENPSDLAELKRNNYNTSEEYRLYFETILTSELLLVEDYSILETYHNTEPLKNNFRKISLLSSLPLIGAFIYQCTEIKYILPIFSIPFVYVCYKIISKKFKNQRICRLLNELTNLTNLIKKCLRITNEFSATIGYYSASSAHVLTINNIYIRFTKEFYAILFNVIKLLASAASEISIKIPLNIENYMKHDINPDLILKSDVNLSDFKLIFELYLLIQSDFLRTIGLSFCDHLWASNRDINILLNSIIPSVINSVQDRNKMLEIEFNSLRNYGKKDKPNQVTPKKYKNTSLNYMSTCLHNTELHFQQLLCKSQDLQNTIDQIDENTLNETKSEMILTMLNEMDKQLTTSKTTLDAVTKYFYQIKNKNSSDSSSKIKPPEPPLSKNTNTVENDEVKPEKLTYELYIPKEGLDLSELEVNTERPVFSVKDLNYSGVMLDELQMILRARNPEMFSEENVKTESDSEDDDIIYKLKRSDIFRPTQPIGLAENLKSITNVLAARKNRLKTEEFCDDTDSDDSADNIR